MGQAARPSILGRIPSLDWRPFDMAPISRRDLIVGGSAAVGGVVIGGTAIGLTTGAVPLPTPAPTSTALTYDAWVAKRKAPYFIGHRGAGGVLPEHTLPS